ncbi:MAG TPA: helix-turn-helix domain-containing protein [Pirellulales bacterium]|jgi:excisionase family DNA binding protein|nr:helix-turn-helix domain-containing protein [Pirellulales bacterium]
MNSSCTEHDDSELLTTEGAAVRLKVSMPTIRRLADAGKLPRVRIGRSVRFRLSDVLAIAA